jgi:hypothetical protein
VWTTRTYDRLARYYDFCMKVLFPFRYRNAKGNSMTYVFDALTWEFERTPGCPEIVTGFLQTWEYCGDYPVALAPNAPRFIMENGSIVDLPGLEKVRLQAEWGASERIILGAEWSPDGDRLAFVTGSQSFDGGTLYLARGDGTGVEQSVSFEGQQFDSLRWADGGASAIVVAELEQYIVDAETLQVEVRPWNVVRDLQEGRV